MNTLVMKFLCSSVTNENVLTRISNIIAERRDRYQRLIVVFGSILDQSVNSTAPSLIPEKFEHLTEETLTVGVQSALAKQGIQSAIYNGSNSGIITCARSHAAKIIDVRPYMIVDQLRYGRVALVAGSQGQSLMGQLSVLGEGGADTAAVALASAFSALKVEFYADLSNSSQKIMKAWLQSELANTTAYDKALQLTKKSSLIHSRSIELARKKKVPINILSFKSYVRKKRALQPSTATGRNYQWKIKNSYGVYQTSLLTRGEVLL